jgi:hypothetical protein
MRRRRWIAGCIPLLLLVVAGCSTPAETAASHKPPVVAASAACQKSAEEHSTAQPVEIVLVEKQGDSSAANGYVTAFENLNRYCAPSGYHSGALGPVTVSFTFTPNVSAALATKIADEMRATGFFDRVTEMTVPPCITSGPTSGSCTSPTVP